MLRFSLNMPPPPKVGASCLRRRFRRSTCSACVEVCPTAALTLTEEGPALDDIKCLSCADCLFVCPAQAIDNIPLPVRYHRQQRLVAPLTAHPASMDELLLWHAQHHIRGLEIDMDSQPGWALAIATLNLRLRALNEPLWQIFPPGPEAMNRLRQRFLPNGSAEKASAQALPEAAARRRAFPRYSEFTPLPDPQKCLLCGACARACPHDALKLDERAFQIAAVSCTGCGICQAVCPAQAIAVTAETRPADTHTLPVYARRCEQCSRDFIAWQDDDSLCALCRHHCHGMR